MTEIDAMTTPTRLFVRYEHTAVTVQQEKESLYRDVYQSFGWIAEGTVHEPSGATVTLTFRRSRELGNRPLLVELQRRCELALTTISDLERSRTSTAATAAWGVASAGTVLLAAAVVTFATGFGGLVFGLLGFAGLGAWSIAYPVYAQATRKRTAQVALAIEQQYDTILAHGRQAGQLLA